MEPNLRNSALISVSKHYYKFPFCSSKLVGFLARFQSHNIALAIEILASNSTGEVQGTSLGRARPRCRVPAYMKRPLRQERRSIFFCSAGIHSSVPAVQLRPARRAGPSQGRREAPPGGLVLDWPSTVLCLRQGGMKCRFDPSDFSRVRW